MVEVAPPWPAAAVFQIYSKFHLKSRLRKQPRAGRVTFALMKPLVAMLMGFVMLLGSLLPQHNLSELAKLPELAEHYRYHRTLAGGELSVSSFLALHYGPAGASHHRNPYSHRDAQDHEKLPLEQQHHNCVLVSFVLPAGARVTAPAPALAWPPATYRPAPGSLYAFGVSRPLLEPPRA